MSKAAIMSTLRSGSQAGVSSVSGSTGWALGSLPGSLGGLDSKNAASSSAAAFGKALLSKLRQQVADGTELLRLHEIPGAGPGGGQFQNRTLKILSIDGGGVRGIMPALCLLKLEARLGKPLHQCFDLIIGTSIGGILAIAIGCAHLSASECLEIFNETNIRRIFPPNSDRSVYRHGYRYDCEQLESLLREHLGSRVMFERQKGDPLVCVVSADVSESVTKPFLFRNYEPNRASSDVHAGTSSAPAWLAGRATSAASTYFPAVRLRMGADERILVDGGQGFNNPCQIAIDEADAMWPGAPIGVILSIGTGVDPIYHQPVNDLLAAVSNTLDASTNPETVARSLKSRFARHRETAYIRVQLSLHQSVPLDCTDQSALSMLRRQVDSSPKVAKKIKRCAEILRAPSWTTQLCEWIYSWCKCRRYHRDWI